MEVDQNVLDEMTRWLVEEFHPEKIFLFGSRAWGTPTEDSDARPTERALRARRCLSDVVVPKDILVKTRKEFDRYADVYASLEAEIVDRGKLLYG